MNDSYKKHLPRSPLGSAGKKKQELIAYKNKLVANTGALIQHLPDHPKMERWLKKMDAATQFMTKSEYTGDNQAVAMTKRPVVVGLWLFVFVFGFLGLWSVLAPLDSAAIAPGTVVLDANKKTIQHLEGGIITEILVKDGDIVKAGAPLIRLNETSVKARQDIFLNQFLTYRATEDRLNAERDNLAAINWGKDLLDARTRPEVQEILRTQQELFESRRKNLIGKLEVLEQRTLQYQEEINGLQSQVKSASDQIALLEEEIKTVRTLAEKGQALRPRLLSLERQQADLQGRRGQAKAMISRANQNIAENNLEIINARNQYLSEVVSSLREAQNGVADLSEKVKVSTDMLDRIVISAPEAGVITGLRYHTVGGVIAPGAEIMDIIPQNDKLVIEAQVDPRDIDVVHKGLKARIHLSAYKTRTVPNVDGEVIYVSADKFMDKNTGRAFYTARVLVDEHMLKELSSHVELYPGMPAEVLIVTGTRTLFGYMMAPITESMRRAFKEQ